MERIIIYAPVDMDNPTMPDIDERPLPTLDRSKWREFSQDRSDLCPGFVLVDEYGDAWYQSVDMDTDERHEVLIVWK